MAKAGTIIIPGWRDPNEHPPEVLLKALRSAYAKGARVVSICSGVFVLAAAGLLDGKRATTHWRYAEKLRSQYPAIQVEPDGSAAGIDLCLHIVRLDYGADIANRVARRLVMPPHRDGGQAQFVPEPVQKTGTAGLAPVLQWLESNFARELRVEDLAAKAKMSPRTFARQFRQQTGSTPHQWLTHLRLLAAQRRLERTDDSMDLVAERVGWQTAATLRQHFSRCLDTTPTSYRQKFSTTQR
jgi:AraC family transcriptional activator FtrA